MVYMIIRISMTTRMYCA